MCSCGEWHRHRLPMCAARLPELEREKLLASMERGGRIMQAGSLGGISRPYRAAETEIRAVNWSGWASGATYVSIYAW